LVLWQEINLLVMEVSGEEGTGSRQFVFHFLHPHQLCVPMDNSPPDSPLTETAASVWRRSPANRLWRNRRMCTDLASRDPISASSASLGARRFGGVSGGRGPFARDKARRKRSSLLREARNE